MVAKPLKPVLPDAEWVPIGSLKEWPENPKEDPEDLGPWVESLREFGQVGPLIARAANRMLIGGHATYRAAKKLKLERVLVRFLDIDERKAEKLSVTISQLERLRKFNESKLADLVRKLTDDDEAMIGFDEDEIARLRGENYESTVEEVQVTDARAEFYLVVSGPLPEQAAVLDALKKHLGKLEGVTVNVTVSEL